MRHFDEREPLNRSTMIMKRLELYHRQHGFCLFPSEWDRWDFRDFRTDVADSCQLQLPLTMTPVKLHSRYSLCRRLVWGTSNSISCNPTGGIQSCHVYCHTVDLHLKNVGIKQECQEIVSFKIKVHCFVGQIRKNELKSVVNNKGQLFKWHIV